jgi:hypothetical protein
LIEGCHDRVEINVILGQMVRHVRGRRNDTENTTEAHVRGSELVNTLDVVTDFEEGHPANSDKRQLCNSAQRAYEFHGTITVTETKMKVPFPCPTKTALLIAYQNETKRYADAVGQLEQKIGVVSRDEYERLRVASEKTRRLSLEALETLDAHSDEHGC